MSLTWKALRWLCLLAMLPGIAIAPRCEAQRPFTVADDIALTYFGDPFLDKAEPIIPSPDGRYFVVHTERGRLDINRPESTLRVYKSAELRDFLIHPEKTIEPSPAWTFSRATYKDGPVITKLRWLRDSSGFAFLLTLESGDDQLFLADLRTRTIRPLTPEGEHVTGFDIRDASHFVYTVLSPAIRERIAAEKSAVSVVGTDRKMTSLLSPEIALKWHDRSELWAVIDNKRHRVEDKADHLPLAIHWRGQLALALSPDGHTLLTALTVPSIPSQWPTLYPPPYPGDAHHINPGPQDPETFDGWFDVARYTLIDLATDSIRQLPLGPLGYEADWIGLPYTDWSKDGTAIALSDTFLDREVARPDDLPTRPCAVVLDLKKNQAECIEPVMGGKPNGDREQNYHLIEGIRFDSQTKDRVILKYSGTPGGASYVRSSAGQWVEEGATVPGADSTLPVQLTVKQGLNDPPVLVATDTPTQKSRVIWDPNPWLKQVALGEVSVYRWKDAAGHALVGGLYKPPDYIPGKKYPLVIQTHGFPERDFIPSGIYPTAFAARELAAAGFMVLQVQGCPIRHTPEEGPCQVAAYESAVKQMAAEGLVDANHVGIVGFSRTCYYALEAITTSAIHFSAAAISNGIDMGYMQYLIADKLFSPDSTSVIGATPFGQGLQKWLERSPEFNMDRVTTPLLVVGVGQIDIVAEWEPYATLWHMNKPVDLILLKEGTHPLTNPAQRMVSQGSTVDWMRFWLKGEEDSNPSKKEQYERWHHLRNLEMDSRPMPPADKK